MLLLLLQIATGSPTLRAEPPLRADFEVLLAPHQFQTLPKPVLDRNEPVITPKIMPVELRRLWVLLDRSTQVQVPTSPAGGDVVLGQSFSRLAALPKAKPDCVEPVVVPEAILQVLRLALIADGVR